MIKRSLVRILAIVVFVITLSSVQTFAGITNVSNNFKNYVQPADNVVKSAKSSYAFFMPESWISNVNAYLQTGQVGDSFLEKVSFYYSPEGSGNVLNKSNESLFLTITVYAEGQVVQSTSEKVIFTQNGYTFTSLVISQNNYKETNSRNAFSKLVANSKSNDFLKKYINFNDAQSQSTTSTVYFKNVSQTSTSYIDNNGVIFIPLRDFANAMNYNITWYQSIKGCRITKNNVSDIVYQKSDGSAYQTKTINNRLYVTTNYLRDKWGITVYIDSKSNVFIS